ETFTVRKQSFGIGVERMFPVHSPKIERIEVAARGDVRRAKLYYLRDRVGKRARVRERRYTGPEETVESGLLYGPTEATDAEGTTANETISEAPGAEAVDGAENAPMSQTENAPEPSSASPEEPGEEAAKGAEGTVGQGASEDIPKAATDEPATSPDAGDGEAGDSKA